MEEQRLEELLDSPDDKSYVFLLYPPSVASTLNPELYIVRVQMRALVVGLLVHQMLLHSIASVLLEGTEINVPSLSNVLMSPSLSSPKPRSPIAFLAHLEPRHVDTFLSALDLSYAAALKFDSRPGLKFLLQKVANLQRPANLYHQACTAWTIKIFTLFELCLREVSGKGVDFQNVGMILSGEIRPDSKHRQLLKYLSLLQTTFDELCGTYVDIALDRDGRYTKIDSIADKKFFLLVSQPDEYTEIVDPNEESVNENNRLVYSVTPNSEDDYADDDSALKDLGVNVPVEEDARPFRLSDLAAEYSTDSGPQSEPETDDSRPCSRLGSSNSRTVYLDRSGGATSEDLVESSDTSDADKVFKSKSLFKTIKTDTPDSEREEAGGDAYPKERMRKSDDCLLSRRYNLKFIQKGELDANKKSIYFRSKSMMELSHPKDQSRILRQASAVTSTNTELPESDDEDLTPEVECLQTAPIDAVKALLEEYERSKRGFRTNPFLQDEHEKMLIANKAMTSIDDDGQAARDANKDSEIRRKAWAETIAASIEYALALTDERLAPLLPVLVGGVRILTRHAHESALKHRLSDLFQRIAHIYETILVDK